MSQVRAEHFRKQLILIASAVPAFVVVTLTVQHASQLFANVVLPPNDVASRLAYAAHWLLFPALTLLVGIMVAGRRAFIADAIDGTRTPASHSLEINLRYNQNTVEQMLLAAIAWIGLALAVSPDQLVVIPAMASLFVVGRITFWIGYLLYPIARAFGMVVTFLPTLGSYAWLLWHTSSR